MCAADFRQNHGSARFFAILHGAGKTQSGGLVLLTHLLSAGLWLCMAQRVSFDGLDGPNRIRKCWDKTARDLMPSALHGRQRRMRRKLFWLSHGCERVSIID